MICSRESAEGFLTDDDVRGVVAKAFAERRVDGKRVLVIIPDATRTAPVGLFFRTINDEIVRRVRKLDYIIALGTHPAMSDQQIDALLDFDTGRRRETYPNVDVFNHVWDDPAQLKCVGTLSADEIDEISGGLMREDVPVEINRRVFDYDLTVIVGPVFPHEVVGFSGGNKYFFPGISGPQVLDFFHWLGALITLPRIIGIAATPVRAVIDRAAALVTTDKLCMSLVTTRDGLKGLYVDAPETAWAAAAELSSKIHIVYREKPFVRALSCAPEMYDDIWTAAKAMYKLEPVMGDGAELIIYAPHVTEVSYVHGQLLDKIGYHVRDYFLKQWDKFKHYPRGVLAHATHVKGIGSFQNGVERPRINVVFATGIPEERCRRVNQGYRDPATINPDDWAGREHEGILYDPHAGETLYRLTDGRTPEPPEAQLASVRTALPQP